MPPDEPKIDTKPAMPAQPPTKQLPAMTDRAMLEDLYRMASSTYKEVQKMGINIQDLNDGQNLLTSRVTLLEKRADDHDTRDNKHSGGVRQLSSNDEQQAAELAAERAAREALAVDVGNIKTELAANTSTTQAIHSQVIGFFNNKKVQFVGKTVWGLAMAYAAARGLKVLP